MQGLNWVSGIASYPGIDSRNPWFQTIFGLP